MDSITALAISAGLLFLILLVLVGILVSLSGSHSKPRRIVERDLRQIKEQVDEA